MEFMGITADLDAVDERKTIDPVDNTNLTSQSLS
jgi:hypothetical protein